MRRIAIVGLLICALALPATALASGSSTCQAYNPQLCSSVSAVSSTKDATSGTTAKTLPFTGFDAVLLVGGGITLLGAGVVVRLLSRRLS
jgi:hypothetical protein